MRNIFVKTLVLTVVMATIGVAFATAGPQPVFADAKTDVCEGIGLGLPNGVVGCTGPTGSSPLNGIVATVVNILSIIVGIIAVVMIILGGIKFITASGDTNSIATARSTVLYAIIGLVVVAMAQVIVRFVLHRVTLPSCPVGRSFKVKPGDCN